MGYIYVDDKTQREMVNVYRQYKLNQSVRKARLQEALYKKNHSVKTNPTWRCNATPPSMRRKSLLEAILTFDSNAAKDAMSYHSTKNLTGFEKIYEDFHNAAVAMYNPFAARDLIKDKYGFLFGN